MSTRQPTSVRVAHGAPPAPLPEPPTPFPAKLSLYRPKDLLHCPNYSVSSKNFPTLRQMDPEILADLLVHFPFVLAIPICNRLYIVSGFEFVALADHYQVSQMLVMVITTPTKADFQNLHFLLTVASRLPGAPDRSGTAIYALVVKLLKDEAKGKGGRLFVDDTTPIEAARSVIKSPTVYKSRNHAAPTSGEKRQSSGAQGKTRKKHGSWHNPAGRSSLVRRPRATHPKPQPARHRPAKSAGPAVPQAAVESDWERSIQSLCEDLNRSFGLPLITIN